jgi:hypothetical protein
MLNQKIVKICEQKFTYLNYSNTTKKTYIHYIKEFIRYCGTKRVIHVNSNDFQFYLDNYNFTSVFHQNQIMNTIQFIYKEVLGITVEYKFNKK